MQGSAKRGNAGSTSTGIATSGRWSRLSTAVRRRTRETSRHSCSMNWRICPSRFAMEVPLTGASTGTSTSTTTRQNRSRRTHAGTRCSPICNNGLDGLESTRRRKGVYADDKRSDIRVSFAGFNVPVEIKRSCHPDLWTAVRSQLIAKYTRDPEAAGYGIYLVFWFGDTEKCRPTKCGGWTPETAEDVRLRIQQSLDDSGRALNLGVRSRCRNAAVSLVSGSYEIKRALNPSLWENRQHRFHPMLPMEPDATGTVAGTSCFPCSALVLRMCRRRLKPSCQSGDRHTHV